MLAARDQENLVHGHQQIAASKPLNQSTRGLQPKTPGNKLTKTPLKIPLQDENAPGGFGGKSVKGKGLENMVMTGKRTNAVDKSAFVTPMGPRTRPALAAKTTNAKAKGFQTPGGAAPEKELESTIASKTSVRRPKKVIHGETVKLQVHGDESPLVEREMEYCPPRAKDLPYMSEDFPAGCLNYNVLKPGNLMRGFHNTYHNEIDDNGLTRMDREYEESYKKSASEFDERIMKMMEEEWTVGDVPETFRQLKKKSPVLKPFVRKPTTISTQGPATIASRKAAVALSVVPKPAAAPPKTSKLVVKPVAKSTSFLSLAKPTPPLLANSTMRHTAATAASRSTIGYSKGRSAAGVFQKRECPVARSTSNMSQGSDTTITPARFAESESGSCCEEWRRLDFLSVFDADEKNLEPGLRGVLPDCVRYGDQDEELFILTLASSS